jgi:hypothetical protein
MNITRQIHVRRALNIAVRQIFFFVTPKYVENIASPKDLGGLHQKDGMLQMIMNGKF